MKIPLLIEVPRILEGVILMRSLAGITFYLMTAVSYGSLFIQMDTVSTGSTFIHNCPGPWDTLGPCERAPSLLFGLAVFCLSLSLNALS